MKRINALLLALALGIAVAAGTFAALRTTQLGSKATATHVSSAQIAKQNRALDRAEATLRAELRRNPPKIAALPPKSQILAGHSPSAPATAATAVAAAPAQTVIYHRPPPIVHVIHRPGGGEHETAAGHGDSGGGLDD